MAMPRIVFPLAVIKSQVVVRLFATPLSPIINPVSLVDFTRFGADSLAFTVAAIVKPFSLDETQSNTM